MKRLLLLLAIIATTATAQEISYGEYMQRVMEGNIALTAKRLDINIADAQLKSSKVYSDPTLAVTYSNNEDWSKKLGQGIEVELSKTFTFGVRKNRIQMSDSERKLTVALIEEYMRNFRADATIAYLEHLRASMLLTKAREILADLEDIASNDSIRFIRGEIAESSWLESRMAMGIARNAMLDAEAECNNTAIKMGYFMGSLSGAESLRGNGTLDISEEIAPIDHYTSNALEHRADIVVALSRADVAEAAKRFNKAQRRPELNAVIGATYNIARPDFTTLKAGIAVPLKFSNLNKGARVADEILAQQAIVEVEEARLLVQADVMQAYNNMLYAIKQTETFSGEMLQDMRTIVESKKRAYELGEIPFIDYLIVERDESEMRRQYIDALFGKAAAWVELQRATGFRLEFATMPIAE
ncbi:MAG: TolC family protein [Bacteroidaceae bacterium]|nr:TolC family protein [Bacteroidaceae bacterium]